MSSLSAFKTAYVPDWSHKLLSAAAAGLSGYFVWRSAAANQYITETKLRSIQEQGEQDSFYSQTGTYSANAPLLTEVSNWLHLRNIEFNTLAKSMQAHAKGVFYILGDAWLPLLTGVIALGAGFHTEIKTIASAMRRALPKTNWPRVWKECVEGIAWCAGQSVKGIKQGMLDPGINLAKRAPLAVGLLSILGYLGANRLFAVHSGSEQRDSLRDDGLKFGS